MSSDKNVDSIFAAAIEIESEPERAAFLAEACDGDQELRGVVEKLVNAHQKAGRFMHESECSDSTADFSSSDREGTVIGPYKLLQELGKGGMGVVYLAEQTEPVKRRVALKIIKPGMDSSQVIARFEAERQALAMMDHPCIAKVFDAGTTDSGRPYFVMELVKGVPITQYCDENRIAPRQRLDMFVQVCQAVQHAHQKGVIHRDLKPQNILVADYDDKAVPKVIDFGIAKATNQSLSDKTLFTHVGQIVGTFEYMSPEQAKMNQLDVDTRSDIYSLGVVLYELLTGATPHERLKQAGLEEILRVIREVEPPKPSTRISESKKSSPALASSRRTNINSLHRFVQGDLDWIIMKSLDKDRMRRYDSANSFAEDLQRYLANEPITARPPSVIYKLQKFTKRNRTSLATSAILVLAFVGMLIGFAWTNASSTAADRVEALMNAPPNGLQNALDKLDDYAAWAKPELVAILNEPDDETDENRPALRARLALTTDENAEHVQELVEALLTENPNYYAVILTKLESHQPQFTEQLWAKLNDEQTSDETRLRAGIAIANNPLSTVELSQDNYDFLAEVTVQQSPVDQAVWLELLDDVAHRCFNQWEKMFNDEDFSLEQVNVAYALEYYARDNKLEQDRIARILAKSNSDQFKVLVPLLQSENAVDLSPNLLELATALPDEEMPVKARVKHGKIRAGASISLLRLGNALQAVAALDPKDDPEVIAQFIDLCEGHGVAADDLLTCLDQVHENDTQSEEDGKKIYALLLALAEYSLEEIAEDRRTALVKQLGDWYANDPRSIVHGATGWILRQWGETDIVDTVDQTPRSYSPDRQWFVREIAIDEGTPSYFTFVVVESGNYRIGSPEDEPGRFKNELQHEVRLTHRYAIADREVTIEEIKAFGEQTGVEIKKTFMAMDNGWAGPGLTWYDSVHFCRWLSEKDGLKEESQAYPAPHSLDPDEFELVEADDRGTPQNWPLRIDRIGYRLPTETEWEVAARARARTSFCYGSDEQLITDYAWMGFNSERTPHPPKGRRPSLRGLFDIHGNMFEWCHDWRSEYQTSTVSTDSTGPRSGDFRVLRGGCWGIVPDFCRVSARLGHIPTTPFPFIGFRVALTLPEKGIDPSAAAADVHSLPPATLSLKGAK